MVLVSRDTSGLVVPGISTSSVVRLPPTSGATSSTITQLWYIEEQRLNFDFLRVANTTWDQTIPTSAKVLGTSIKGNINAMNVKTAQYGTFSGEATIPQKFKLISDSSSGGFGLSGILVNWQAYYERRAWYATDSSGKFTYETNPYGNNPYGDPSGPTQLAFVPGDYTSSAVGLLDSSATLPTALDTLGWYVHLKGFNQSWPNWGAVGWYNPQHHDYT